MMADDTHEALSELLRQIQTLEIATDSGEWIALPGFLKAGPWEWYALDRSPPTPTGEADIETAVRNLQDIFEAWERLLQTPALAKVKGGPDRDVLRQLIFTSLHGAADRAWLKLFDGKGDYAGAVAALQKSLERAAIDMSPHVGLLVAAVQVAMRQCQASSPPRWDDPSTEQIEAARRWCKENPRITREALRLKMKISPAKVAKLIDMMRDEGLHQSKKRKSPRKKT